MEVVVVLVKDFEAWVLFGVFSSLERAIMHLDVERKNRPLRARFIRAEIGVAYAKEPPAETYG